MKTKIEVEKELFELMNSPCGPMDYQIDHRAGRIRSLAWVLTGEDVGFECLANTPSLLETLGWKWWKKDGQIYFESPYEIEEVVKCE